MRAEDRAVGERIAQGNTSEVRPWTRQTVVKVLLPGIPDHWAAIEADITSRVHSAGLPVPAVDGVVEVDGRPGVVFERIDGETMWHRMKASSDELPALIDTFIDIQVDIQAAPAVEGLPDLATRLRRKIGEAEPVSSEDRDQARALLAALPRGSALCHGDMHPANIIISPRGIVIVDWFDAAIGQPVADHTRSSLLLRPLEAPSARATHLDGASSKFLQRVHCAYLSALVMRGLIEPSSFATWEAILAVARMGEPVPTEDLVRIWSRWRAAGSGASSLSLERCMERASDETGPNGSGYETP